MIDEHVRGDRERRGSDDINGQADERLDHVLMARQGTR